MSPEPIPPAFTRETDERFNLDHVAFFGRSLAEYESCFGFCASDWRGRKILDVAAGPSSFVAEALSAGVNAVACDPLYGRSHSALRHFARWHYAEVLGRIRESRSKFSTRTFPTIEAAEADRLRARSLFLEDFPGGFAQGRYVCGSLPTLAFGSRRFDHVLCGHFLFIYGHLLDYAFHLNACRELVRVAKRDVRIHPLVDDSGNPHHFIPRLRADLADEGVESRVVSVDHEFFPGTDTTLVLLPPWSD